MKKIDTVAEAEWDEADAQYDKEADAEWAADEPRQPRKGGANPFEKKLSVTILSKTFYGIFKLGALLTRSTAEFEVEEFKEPASDLLDMVNRYKPLKLVFNVLHPVVSCVSLIGKVQKLRDGLPASKQAKVSRETSAQNGTGAHGEEVLGSMFGPRPIV